MAIDVKKIDDKIKKLEMLKLLASDPEMVELLEGVVTPNETTSGGAPEETQATATKTKRGDQRKAVLKSISEMLGRFSALDILEAMERGGFQFSAKSPIIAVNGVLRKLVKGGSLTVAVEGSGTKGHVYEREERVSAPQSAGNPAAV